MLGLTPNTTGTPLGGKQHSYMPPGSSTSPVFGPVQGLKSYSTVNPITNFGRPTDAGDDQNLTDRSRVSMAIPAAVKHGAKDFIFPQGSVLFVWGAKDTIDRSTIETYEILGVSDLNHKMNSFQNDGYSVLEALAFGKRMPMMISSSISRELSRDKASSLESKMGSFYMDLHSLGRMINLVGTPFSDVTQGTAAAFSILKKSGGCLFNVIHEGSAEMGNIWDDLSPAAKANLILTKKSLIDIRNPFHRRPFQIYPVSSVTGSGDGTYCMHGVKPTNESASAKRSRISTDVIITKKRVIGEIKDKYDELEFLTFSHSYNRFCMVLNPEVYESSAVTGTIASVRNHEKKTVRGKEHDIISTHVTPTFLDWSWSKPGPEYVSGPKMTKNIYSWVFWNIKRQDGLLMPVGVVTSGLRGKVPPQEVLQTYLFTDHENQKRASQELFKKSKITLHIRLQL